MKFNCGLTREEKKVLAEAKWEKKLDKEQHWHDFFAWYPVRLGSRDCRWLETVEQKGQYWAFHGYFTYEYRAKEQE